MQMSNWRDAGNPRRAQSVGTLNRRWAGGSKSRCRTGLSRDVHPVQQPSRGAVRHLEDIEYLLTQLAEASFQLLRPKRASRRSSGLVQDGKEQKSDPQGLYLTDQR